MAGDDGIGHRGATPDEADLQRISPRKQTIRVVDATHRASSTTGRTPRKVEQFIVTILAGINQKHFWGCRSCRDQRAEHSRPSS
jgi:hypothetical protein